MLLWMDFWSDLEQQVKSGINLHNQTSSFETTENNKFVSMYLINVKLRFFNSIPKSMNHLECREKYEKQSIFIVL